MPRIFLCHLSRTFEEFFAIACYFVSRASFIFVVSQASNLQISIQGQKKVRLKVIHARMAGTYSTFGLEIFQKNLSECLNEFLVKPKWFSLFELQSGFHSHLLMIFVFFFFLIHFSNPVAKGLTKQGPHNFHQGLACFSKYYYCVENSGPIT